MESREIMLVIVGFAGGVFSLAGAIFNWDWFMNSRRARFFAKILGLNGARIFYAILGFFLIGLGIWAMLQ